MNKAVRIAWAVSIVAIVAASCAKEPSDNLGEKQMAAFDAWVGLYGDGAEKQPSGIYIKKLHSASGVIKPPVEYDWIQLDYTGRIMVDGDVFVTRDSAVAVEQGTFEYFTHYVPQMIQFYEDGDLPRGVYDAVGTMNEGGSRPGIRSLYARLRQLRPVVYRRVSGAGIERSGPDAYHHGSGAEEDHFGPASGREQRSGSVCVP